MTARYQTEGGGSLSTQETRRRSSGASSSKTRSAIRPLASRLRPPHSLVPLLPREALIASLLRRPRDRSSWSRAPAGYGKTTTARAVGRRRRPRPFAWLQLDAATMTPSPSSRTWRSRSARSPRWNPWSSICCDERDSPIEELVMPAFAAALGRADPFLLVLDDGHLVRNQTCWRLLATVFEPASRGGAAVHRGPSARSSRPRGCARTAGWRSTTWPTSLWTAGEVAALLALHRLDPRRRGPRRASYGHRRLADRIYA